MHTQKWQHKSLQCWRSTFPPWPVETIRSSNRGRGRRRKKDCVDCSAKTAKDLCSELIEMPNIASSRNCTNCNLEDLCSPSLSSYFSTIVMLFSFFLQVLSHLSFFLTSVKSGLYWYLFRAICCQTEWRIPVQDLLVPSKPGPVNHTFRSVFHPLIFVTEMVPRITQTENCVYVSRPSVSKVGRVILFLFFFKVWRL